LTGLLILTPAILEGKERREKDAAATFYETNERAFKGQLQAGRAATEQVPEIGRQIDRWIYR